MSLLFVLRSRPLQFKTIGGLNRSFIGHLNQNELSFQIDQYVTADPNIEHLHNQLIAGIFANVGRDLPEPGVAPWVSANDKPTVLAKPVSGDAAEQRLKTEIMRLPARDRRRLKEVPDVSNGIPRKTFASSFLDMACLWKLD